ncbi:TRAP transporter substrate-binding protein [Orrella sp. JC864]|uniref:TRAP transporter substrate-binding protein n=1 Tax=Orrella sp. JC864 TaxID=3120298 RepID=UPI003008ADEB
MKLLHSATIAATLLACGPALAQTTWTMPTAYPDTNFHTRNLKQFADEVAKETDGKLKITIHSGGALIKMPEIKRAVQTGQVQIGEIFIGTMANEAPLYSFDSIPFMTSGHADAQKLWAAARPLVEERLDKQNLHVLYSVAWPAQGLYTKKAVEKVEDFKGLKFRTPSPSTADFAKRLGAVPTVVQAADIPQAFLTGLVEAMLTSSSTGVDTQAWDYLENFYSVPTMFPQNIVFVNKRAWEQLDEGTRKIVTAAAERAEARGWQMSADENETSIKKMQENKLNVQEVSPALLDSFKKVGAEMATDWMAKLTDQERAALEPAIKK